MKRKYLWTVFPIILVTGCASLQLPSSSHVSYQRKTWEQRRVELSHLHAWNINGAFSIQQSNNKSAIASYAWQQRGSAYDIYIRSSLDVYSARIMGKPGYVTLERSNRQQFSAHSAEQLMQQQLGWSLPISNLFYWMRGLPAPGGYQAQFDSYGHLIFLQQAGWRLWFSNYFSVRDLDLPRTLILIGPTIKAKIVAKNWRI